MKREDLLNMIDVCMMPVVRSILPFKLGTDRFQSDQRYNVAPGTSRESSTDQDKDASLYTGSMQAWTYLRRPHEASIYI